jgi:fructose-1,6-bisphosphatase/inositol monophosphatase family enzyme
MDLTPVAAHMRAVSDAEIRPRFRALADHDIRLKGPGDYVTEADESAERALGPLLRSVLDVPVVGEEATAANPALVDAVRDAERAWVVDPVDGTANFVHGSPIYAVMVALVEHGRTSAGWVLHPETGTMYSALPGEDATIEVSDQLLSSAAGASVGVPAPSARTGDGLRGGVAIKYAAEQYRRGLASAQEELGEYVTMRMCEGFDYADLVTGEVDYLVFSRALPWDHAPGAAIARASGCTVGRLDGSDYLPGVPGAPLLAARDDVYEDVRSVLARHLGL